MPKVLKPQQISMLERDGYVAPISVFSKQEAEAFRTALEAFEASVKNEPKEETLATLARFKPHLLFTWLDNICHDPNLLDIIEDLIGPDLLIYSSHSSLKILMIRPMFHGTKIVSMQISKEGNKSAPGLLLPIVMQVTVVCAL